MERKHTKGNFRVIYRDLIDVLRLLGILALGGGILLGINFFPAVRDYFRYQSQSAGLEDAAGLRIYFDGQYVRDVPPEEIALYTNEIRRGRIISWQSACPFTVKLTFILEDKSTHDVLLGTDGCKQIQLPSGMQSTFRGGGKLAELEKEYQITEISLEPAG